MASMGLDLRRFRSTCTEQHLDHFLDSVVPASVKNVAAVAFGSQHEVIAYLKQDANSDLNEGLYDIGEAIQDIMHNTNFEEGVEDLDDVADFDPSLLYFPTGNNGSPERAFIQRYLKTPIFNNGPPVVVAMYVALGILLNLRDHYEERASYSISPSVAIVSSWEKTKVSTLHGIFYMIIVMFKTGGEMSKGCPVFQQSLDDQKDEFDPFYSIFAYTVLRWTQQIFPDVLNYLECKGNDSCSLFVCSRSQRQCRSSTYSQEGLEFYLQRNNTQLAPSACRGLWWPVYKICQILGKKYARGQAGYIPKSTFGVSSCISLHQQQNLSRPTSIAFTLVGESLVIQPTCIFTLARNDYTGRTRRNIRPRNPRR